MDALVKAGVPAYSIAPGSLALANRGTVRWTSVESLVRALDGGLVPVLFGDVVMDRAWRASICSTESAFLAVARALLARGVPVERALWIGTTDGVLDDRGRPIARVFADRRAGFVLRHAGGSEGTDVTGGMNLRVRAAISLARRGVPSWIGDGTVPGRIRDVLAGRSAPGTSVVPPA
jgi:isopentenyl phosphate kinase